MKIKNIVLIFALTGVISNCLSQVEESDKLKEIDFSINSLQNLDFGLDFKSKLKSNTYFRLELFELDFTSNKNIPNTGYSFNTVLTTLKGTIGFGIEKRKIISEKLMIYSGIDLLASGYFRRSKTNDPRLTIENQKNDSFFIGPGVGMKSGLYYNVFDNVYVGFSVFPQVHYRYRKDDRNYDESSNIAKAVDFRTNIDEVSLSVLFRWK